MLIQAEQLLEPGASLTAIAVAAPEPAERQGELEPNRAIASVICPLERRAHVVVLATLLRDRHLHHRRLPFSCCHFSQPGEVMRMPSPNQLGLRAGSELLQCV